MPTPEEHALLSASGSSRWLHCTRAPRLEEQFPESTSVYAEAGRVAHAIAELKARKYFLEPMSARSYNAALRKLKKDPAYDSGMDEATDQYLDYLKSLAMSFETPPFVALETRVDYSAYAPKGFGTADCIMIGGGRLCVCDYKNGSGVPVSPVENSQMMLYALGALAVYAPVFGDSIQTIHLAIIQPNAGGVKEWEITRAELEQWGETTVKPAAALAWAGEGAFCPSADPNGWCRFCRAKSTCTARTKMMLELENYIEHPSVLLSEGEIGNVLKRALGLEAWVKELKEYALAAALKGQQVNGFKVVEGRGSRDWTDLDKAFDILRERGVQDAALWERKPVSVAGLEKALGKKVFADTAEGLVVKKPGKPALVPDSDPRKPYNPAGAVFQKVTPDV